MFYVTTTHSFYLIVGHLRLQILNLTLLSLFFIDNIKAIARNISTLKHLKPWQEIRPMVTWWQVTVLFTWSLIDGVISTNYLDSQPLQLRNTENTIGQIMRKEAGKLASCSTVGWLFICLFVCAHMWWRTIIHRSVCRTFSLQSCAFKAETLTNFVLYGTFLDSVTKCFTWKEKQETAGIEQQIHIKQHKDYNTL